MGNLQVGVVNDLPAIKQNIQIEGARPPMPVLFSLVKLLDGLQRLKQLSGGE